MTALRHIVRWFGRHGSRPVEVIAEHVTTLGSIGRTLGGSVEEPTAGFLIRRLPGGGVRAARKAAGHRRNIGAYITRGQTIHTPPTTPWRSMLLAAATDGQSPPGPITSEESSTFTILQIVLRGAVDRSVPASTIHFTRNLTDLNGGVRCDNVRVGFSTSDRPRRSRPRSR